MPIGLQVDELILDSVFKALYDYAVVLGYAVDTSIYPENYTEANIADYNDKRQTIKSTKGFDVQIFSQSSARYKGKVDAPRIVVFLSRVLPGDIGAPISTMITEDKDNAARYQEGFLVPQASNLVLAVHLISSNSPQTYLLNQIWGKVLGQRRILPFISGGGRFFIEQTSFNDLDDPLEQITEKCYFHTIPDVYMGEMDVTRPSLPPLSEIKLDIFINENETDEPDNETIIQS